MNIIHRLLIRRLEFQIKRLKEERKELLCMIDRLNSELAQCELDLQLLIEEKERKDKVV